MYAMPGEWAAGQIHRMMGPHFEHPLATTHTHVAWESPLLRLECNLVRNVATSQDDFAVRIMPAVEPYYPAVVIPVDSHGSLYLVGRYRYPISRWSIEFPRFDLDSSDAGWKDAAEADLRRATGLTAERMNLLGAIQIDPALMSLTTVVILAQGCTPAADEPAAITGPSGASRLAAREVIAGSVAVSLPQMLDLVGRGEIVCGVTLATFALYRAHLQ
jgi:hypothetical protein